MKKYLKFSITMLSLLVVVFIYQKFNNTSKTTLSQETKIKKSELPKHARVKARGQQEIEMTKDPTLGYVPNERLWVAQEYATKLRKEVEESAENRSPISGVSWTTRGPVNVGGRTRAIMFDPTDGTNKRVFAGAISGGLWKNEDITSAVTSWTPINDFLANLSISALAYDPTSTSTWYMTTGEAFSEGVTGNGVYKSTNAGSSWSHLASSADHNFISSIVVRDESGTGIVYIGEKEKFVSAGSSGNVFKGKDGLYRSTDGGTTWTQVLPLNSNSREQAVDHVAIDADGHLWASTGLNSFGDKGGNIYTCSSGCDVSTNWTVKYTAPAANVDRTFFAIAPSTSGAAKVIYMISTRDGVGKFDVVSVIKSTDSGSNWSTMGIPLNTDPSISCTATSDHFTYGQGTYDLCMAVHPTNPNYVLFGAIDMYRTTDGFGTYSHVSDWVNGPTVCNNVMHADHHTIVFRPGATDEVVFGNDGGVFYSSDAGSGAATPAYAHRVKDYNVTQFYACDIHPTTGTNIYIAGAQDNGTAYFNNSSTTTEVNGGDGCFAHIDQNNPAIQISSYIYNDYTYTNDTWATSNSFTIGMSKGRFINPTAYDYVNDILYGAHDADFITRSSGFAGGSASGTAIAASIGGAQATTFRVSRNTPTTLYVGNDAGKVYKIENANTGSMTPVSISTGLPSAGWVSSIDVEKGDEMHLLVTFSNYGLTSVYESTNGGTSWTSVEGNLPDMPVRWGVFSPVNNDQALLATELGVWSTDNLNGGSTVWGSTNSALANVRCDMIQYRHDDGTTRAAASATLAVATFGRGLFTAPLTAPLPVELYAFDATPRVAAISLAWKTGSESNNKGFEIQRSTNQNSEFSAIGWVVGNGTTNFISNYSFNDDDDVKSEVTYYYRLKQVDFDGGFEYSDIISAEISKSDEKTLSIYPNPAFDQVTVQLPFSTIGFAINLFDSNGRLVKTWKSEKDALTQELGLANLPKGNYTLNINNQQIQQSAKLLIAR